MQAAYGAGNSNKYSQYSKQYGRGSLTAGRLAISTKNQNLRNIKISAKIFEAKYWSQFEILVKKFNL